MKTDNSIDYYAVLGIDPNAGDGEIKKAFRTQALLHHPDRNPGKEEEAKSRFQDVHDAYDILIDKEKRNKYDQSRQRKSSLWERSAPAPTPRSGSQTGASTFQHMHSARPQRSSATRYASFTESARAAPSGASANTRFEDFKAFENIRGGHRPFGNQRPEPPPRQHRPPPTAQRSSASKARSRGEWDEDLAAKGKPQMFRSQSTRSPRKTGFDPYAVGGDEPGTQNMSANYRTRGERAQSTESKFHTSSPVPNRSPRPHSMAFGESFSPDRTSMPYAARSGEKTYFSAAGLGRSSKSFTNMGGMAPQDFSKASGSGTGRFRSASPHTRTPQPQQEEETSSSDSEDETYTDSMKFSQQQQYGRRASANPRFHGVNVTVEDDVEEDPKPFSKASRHQTWTSRPPKETETRTRRPYPYPPPPQPGGQFFPKPSPPRQPREQRGSITSDAASDGPPRGNGAAPDMPGGQAKRPSLYDLEPFLCARINATEIEKSPFVCAQKEYRTKIASWPYWAIPSSVTPSKKAKIREPIPEINNGYHEALCKRRSFMQNNDTNTGDSFRRFSIPSSSSSSAAPSNSASTENVNVQFAPPNWHGRFNSPTQPGNPTSPPGAFGSKARGSPPKRPGIRPTQASPGFTRFEAGRDVSQSQQMPPPPPPPTKTQAGEPSEVQTPTSTSPSKFPSEEWRAQFQDQYNWAKPATHPPPRQMQTPKSRNPRAAQAKQAAANERTGHNDAAEDTGNDGDDEARQSGSNIDTEGEMSRSVSGTAMEIDTETPPTGSRDSSNRRMNGFPGTNFDRDTTSPTSGSSFPRPPEPQTGLNMQHLRTVYPFNGSSSAGLDGLKTDLGSSLPFTSGTEPEIAPMPQARVLNLPQPPKAPTKPVQYNLPACEDYMKSFSRYIRGFQSFNGRMLTHFSARQSEMVSMTVKDTEAAEKGYFAMCTGAGQGQDTKVMADTAQWSWMGARSNEGYMRYMAWLEEDDRVEEHWRVAWELHREAMKDLGEVRKEAIALATKGHRG